jgi:REP-associated tyrosine transposase
MPRRPAIDPEGLYHIGSRGTYGRPLFRSVDEHELFLWLFARTARKYRWETLAWVLMKNHHHFVIRLTEGGLSEGLRIVHGGYSRRIHERYGQTRKGHLFRHAFFARELQDTEDVIWTCAYVDANPGRHRANPNPRASDWCGYAAALGRKHPRRFHSPSALLELIDNDPRRARAQYRELVANRHALERHGPSPNDGSSVRFA